ncbi:MAG: hypothetical protein HC896_02820 [Bacteroidales bacterium]|nr:hypothetical protein [Bacteroidales bacterium]
MIKANDKRDNKGTIKTAHIMVMTPRDITEEMQDSAKAKIQRVYQELMNGGDFAELAANYSEDRGTSKKGGELPEFSTGQMVPEFEAAAFALGKDGDISEPIKTSYGWHIVKRISLKSLPPYEDYKEELTKLIDRSDRKDLTEQRYVAKLKKEYNLKKETIDFAKLASNIDSTALYERQKNIVLGNGATRLFEIDGKPYTLVDFAAYLSKEKVGSLPNGLEGYLAHKLSGYVDAAVVDYEKEN